MNPSPYVARPVIPLLLCLVTGMVLGHELTGHTILPLLTAIFSFVMVIRAICIKRNGLFFSLLFFISLGYLLIQKPYDLEQRLTSNKHIRSYAEQGDVFLLGTVHTNPEPTKRDQTFILDSIVVQGEQDLVTEVQGKLRVRLPLSDPVFKKSDRVSISGRIKPFRNFHNPGGFDYKSYMENDDVWGNLYVRKGDFCLVSAGERTRIDRMRCFVEAFIDRSSSTTEGKEILKALITGNKKGIPEDLRNDFARTGTSHLLAISGLHVGMVAGFSFMVFRYLLSFVPLLLWQGSVRIWAGILTLLPVWLYAVMAGMSPSTQRAAIMASVVLLAYSFLAEHDIMNTLFIAALVILSISPDSLFQISFQLSFASVFSIVWGMDALAKKTSVEGVEAEQQTRKPIGRKFGAYMAVSLFAFAGTWPLVAHYFNQISIIGFLANALLIPMVGMGVVPLGLSAALLGAFADFPASQVMNIAGYLTDSSIMAIRFFSSFPWAAWKTVTPSILEMACYYTLLVSLTGLVKSRESGGFQRKSLITAAVAAFLILCLDGAYWIGHRYVHRNLRVTWLDVGQGSSALVEFPGGRSMLIDGGGFSDNDMFDVGEKLVAPFLWSKKIARVETVVLSHPESDHLNGLLYILEHFRVGELWTSGVERDTRGFQRMMELAALKKIRVVPRDDLMDRQVLNGVDVHVFWPLKSGNPDTIFYSKNTNNMSLVLKLSLGEQSFLFPGDILEPAETAMIESMADPGLLKSRVLLVPHHGSKTSSSERFIQAVSPSHAVISAGYQNRFRFPHALVLERLEGAGAKAYRTDLGGAVFMSTDGHALWIRNMLERSSQKNPDV